MLALTSVLGSPKSSPVNITGRDDHLHEVDEVLAVLDERLRASGVTPAVIETSRPRCSTRTDPGSIGYGL